MSITSKLSGGALALAIVVGFSSQSAHAADVVETAIETEQLSTLVALVTQAELVDTLQALDGITVFAPTNDAFEKLPRALIRAIESDPSILTSILTYHVSLNEYLATDVVEMNKIDTVQNTDIRVRTAGDRVYLNNAKVTAVDVIADNGVVHLIDKGLIPIKDRDFVKAVVSALRHSG